MRCSYTILLLLIYEINLNMILWFFELGYVLQHIAIFFQIKQIIKKRNTEGVSFDTIKFFVLGTICRIIWISETKKLREFHFTYFEVILAVASISYIFYLYHKYKHHDYIKETISIPVYIRFYTLLALILVMSFFFHPGKKNDYYLTSQMFVSVNIFSECIGLIPQLYLITKSSETGVVSKFYLIFLGFARFFRIFFWLKMYFEGSSFLSLVVADLFHSILLALFIYVYKKNLSMDFLPTDRKKIF